MKFLMNKYISRHGYISVEIVIIVAIILIGGLIGISKYTAKGKETTTKTNDTVAKVYKDYGNVDLSNNSSNSSSSNNSSNNEEIINENLGILSSYNRSTEKFENMTIYDSQIGTLGDGAHLDIGHGRIDNIKANTYYTLSFYTRTVDSSSAKIRSYFYPQNVTEGYSSQGATTHFVDGWIDSTVSNEWQRISITWKTRSDVSGSKYFIAGRILNPETSPRVQIAGIKLEEGKISTKYSEK